MKVFLTILWMVVLLLPYAIFWLSGYVVGGHRWRRRSAAALSRLHENMHEIEPFISVIGFCGPFDHAIVDFFGKPPKRASKTLASCDECNHLRLWHRPTVTVIASGDETSGDTIPIAVNAVCKFKDCRCVRRIIDGEMEIHHVDHDDD